MTALVPVDEETARLAEQVARRTGRALPDVVREAVHAEARRVGVKTGAGGDHAERLRRMLEVTEPFAGFAVRDERPADEILGFDEHGAPR